MEVNRAPHAEAKTENMEDKEGKAGKGGGKDKTPTTTGRRSKTPKKRRGSREKDKKTNQEDMSNAEHSRKKSEETQDKQNQEKEDIPTQPSTPQRKNSLLNTVTNTAKAMIGIPSKEEQQSMTIEVKKEKIDDNYAYATPTRTTLRQTNLHGEIIDMTVTPTPQKRKKQELNKNSSKPSTGNEKKKTKPVHVITPKRMIMDRENNKNKDENKTTQEENGKVSPTREQQNQAINNKPHTKTISTPTNSNKKNESETKKYDQTEAHQHTNKSNKTNTQKKKDQSTNEQNPTKTPVINPYKPMQPKTPIQGTNKVSTNDVPISYAAALSSPQTKIITHSKQRSTYNHRYDISWINEDVIENDEQEVAQLSTVLRNIIKRAQKVDRKAMINTWSDQKNMPTIVNEIDIPATPSELRAYLSHQMKDKKVTKGKNTSWRINLTYSIEPEIFIRYWEQSRAEYTDVPFVYLKSTPMQAERYYCCGTLINSSEKQETKYLERELKEELQLPISLAFRTAPLDRATNEELWTAAMKKKIHGKKYIYQYAPLSLNIYTDTAEHARNVAKYMMDNYGSQQEGQYPRMPDGSRMRFIPASRFLDMAGRETAKKIFANQINFNTEQVILNLPIKDIYKRFEDHDNMTMMELLLDLKSPEHNEEPYFRHIVRKWTKDPKKYVYQVSVHGQMEKAAIELLETLEFVLDARYGSDVADQVYKKRDNDNDTLTTTTKGDKSTIKTTLSIDTSDRYMNGSARFIIEGMEALAREKEETQATLQEKRMQEDEHRSMAVASVGTNKTNETVYTLPGTSTNHTQSSTTYTYTSEQGAETSTPPPTQTPRADNEGWKIKGGLQAEARLRMDIDERKAPDPGDPREKQL